MGKNMLKKLICAGFISGTLFIGSMAEAGVVTDRLPLTCYEDHKVISCNSPGAKSADYISANVDLIQITQVRGDDWCYYAAKKKTYYQCKICGRTFNLMLTARGHVKGVHHKFLTLPHVRTIKG